MKITSLLFRPCSIKPQNWKGEKSKGKKQILLLDLFFDASLVHPVLCMAKETEQSVTYVRRSEKTLYMCINNKGQAFVCSPVGWVDGSVCQGSWNQRLFCPYRQKMKREHFLPAVVLWSRFDIKDQITAQQKRRARWREIKRWDRVMKPPSLLKVNLAGMLLWNRTILIIQEYKIDSWENHCDLSD